MPYYSIVIINFFLHYSKQLKLILAFLQNLVIRHIKFKINGQPFKKHFKSYRDSKKDMFVKHNLAIIMIIKCICKIESSDVLTHVQPATATRLI